MANTLGTPVVTRGGYRQFQANFTDVWQVKLSVTDQDAVAINDTLVQTITVPGVALGDVIIANSIDAAVGADAGGDGAVITFRVTAANTVSMYVHADVAEYAADTLNGANIRLLIGRPGW